MIKSYYTEFFTATVLNWQKLLKDDNFKQIIVDSLQWLVEKNRCSVYAFVIMPNHMHLLWRIATGLEREMVQGAFLSFTAHAFKKRLKQNTPLLPKFYVDAKDRSYQFWQREPMVKEVWTERFLLQKLNYIHYNPCQPHWQLAAIPEDYKWSSALFYERNIIEPYTWLTHYKD
ncbi:MAG TPA: transposase [Parafilimonas sp.]|nr:transposase [Parafilimonas sp.]